MSDYLVRVEEYSREGGYRRYRIRPLKEVINGRLYDLSRDEFDRDNQTFLIWDAYANKVKANRNIEDGAYVVCEKLQDYIKEELGASGGTVKAIKASDFGAIGTNVNTGYPWNEIIKVDVPDSMTLQTYLHQNRIIIGHRPFSRKVYLSDGKKVFGPFGYNTENGQFNVSVPEYKVGVFDKEIGKNDVQEISFVCDGELITFDIIDINKLPKKEDEIDCLTDTDLKKMFDVCVDQFYNKLKRREELASLKTVVKGLPRFRLSDERIERIRLFVENGEGVSRAVESVYINGFSNFPEEVKIEISEVIFNQNRFREELYRFARERNDYRRKLDELIGQYAVKEQIDRLEELRRNRNAVAADFDRSQLDVLKKQVDILEEEKSKLNVALDNQKKENEKLIIALRDQKEENDGQKNKKRVIDDYPPEIIEMIDSGKSKYELFSQLKEERDRLDKECSNLDNEIREKEAQKTLFENNLSKRKEELQASIEGFIEAVPEYYEKISFDSALSSRMLQAAAKYQRKNREYQNSLSVAKKENLQKECIIEGTPEELVEYIHKSLNDVAHRKISKNEVANIVVCIAQGFLTILAGEPGSGKTSLVSYLAEIIGYTNEKSLRYTEIAVEKGWTSKRDLIGYYNPLTKSFDAANGGLFSALATLHEEYKQNIEDFPYWVLLDEANLSQMEHYWADFMGVCDLDKKNRRVSLSEEYVYNLPQTLRFLATINLDHTTETISPRLIDRAWIVRLNAQDIDLDNYMDPVFGYSGTVTYDTFNRLRSQEYCNPDNLSDEVKDRFRKIRDIWQEKNITLSPRIVRMIYRYCMAASHVMDMETPYTALDYAIAQKVLPMINGYGEEYADFINSLVDVCDSSEMPVCYRILMDIKTKAESNMQYYQFFAR